MSGTIGIIAQDQSRYSMFWMHLLHLQRPVNTQLLMRLTSDRIIGRNSVAQEALETGSEWLLFLDDDQTFRPDILTKLLARDEPVVGALYLQRQRPFFPIAFTEKTEKEIYVPLRLSDHGPEDLVPVAGLGTGGMLIRSEVFRALDYPWFEHGKASEDLIFCDKAIAAGFPVYCDVGVRMGHYSMTSIHPHYDVENEQWVTGAKIADGQEVTLAAFELDDEQMAAIRAGTLE